MWCGSGWFAGAKEQNWQRRLEQVKTEKLGDGSGGSLVVIVMVDDGSNEERTMMEVREGKAGAEDTQNSVTSRRTQALFVGRGLCPMRNLIAGRVNEACTHAIKRMMRTESRWSARWLTSVGVTTTMGFF